MRLGATIKETDVKDVGSSHCGEHEERYLLGYDAVLQKILTDVSEEHAASIFRVEKFLLFVCSASFSTRKMAGICFSEMSVNFYRIIWRNITEGSILQSL
jgi:hypothetical protein